MKSGPLCLVTIPTLAMPQNLFDEEKTESKRIDTLIHGVLLDGSRKSWKTFSFEMYFRNGGYIKYSQTGSVKQRGKGKPKKPNSSLQPSLQPDLTHETGVTEPSPPLPPGPLPGPHPTPHPTSLQSTVGPAGTPRSITPTQSTEVLISQTLGLAGKYLDILDRGEKRVFEGAPSPSPSCDLDFDLKVGDSASTNPRQFPKKKVCFKSSQVTRSALPQNLLRADRDNSVKQLDGCDSSSGSSSDSSGAVECAVLGEDVQLLRSSDSAIEAGEWKVARGRGRGAKNRFRSPPATRLTAPPATHPVTETGTGSGPAGDRDWVPGLSTAEILRRLKAWPGGATFDGEVSSDRK